MAYKISDSWKGVASFTFGANNKATNTDLTGIAKDIVVKDQYGCDITSEVAIVYDISSK